MAASVVDLPEPVAPTTNTNPRFVIAMSLIICGSQLFDGFDFSLDMPEDQSDISSLAEDVDTEPAQFFVVEGQVHFHFFFELPTLWPTHERQSEGFELFVGEGWGAGLFGRSMNTIDGRSVDGQVQVRSFLINHDF